ncbi:MAG: exosome complex component Rrp42 [Candidatus Micrarchaeota archaeon]|nr:MAG: exosome complex component Rrp42 [Candidatus Micrarchaeota archaeon]
MKDLADEYYIRKIESFVSENKRIDGRAQFDFREIKYKLDYIRNAEGSCYLELGNTKVIAGIKIEAEEPLESSEEGNLITNVELLPLASSEYEAGPPTPEAIELSRVIDRAIRSAKIIDSSNLLLEDNKVYSLYADIDVINFDGNIFDAGVMALLLALKNTRIPKYENGEIIRNEIVGKLNIKGNVLSTTFVKINKTLLLDPNALEELAASTRLTIATDGDRIRAMQKGLSGSLTIREIENMIDISLEKYKDLSKIIDINKD